MTSPSPYLQTLQALKGKRDRLIKKLHSDNATDDDDKRLHKILTDVCENVRAASKDPAAADAMPALLDQTSKMLDATIMMAYDSDAFDFLSSYAHTEDFTAPLIKDPTQQANLIGQLGDPLIELMQRVLGLPPQRGGSLPGSLPRHVSFDSTPKPHANTSPLARFRDDSVPEIPSSAPNAQAVYYGACSVSSDDVPPLPDQIITHPNADVLVMTGCSGWKQRDPFLAYFKIADVGNKWEGAPEVEVMECGLLDIARHIALDPTRKLIWAADDKRAKSYTYDIDGYRPVHTLACQRSGPLAIVDNGARVLRAGAKGVDVWNLDGLPTHGPEGDKHIGKGRINISNTSRDPDDLEDTIERSPGVKRTSSIDFDGSIEKWHLPSWWSTGGSLKAISSGFMARSTVVARDLQVQGKITQRYIGHGGDVHSITSSDADTSAFLTSASDGIVRLFDIRQPLPQLSIDSGEGSERTYSSLYVHVDGIPVIFTGGTHKTQSIKVWDPRAKKLVYELATGNNAVHSLAWDAPRATLYAATECDAMDRMGYRHDYRQARVRDFKIHDRRGQPPEPQSSQESKGKGKGNEMDVDAEDEEDEEDYGHDRGWPDRSSHNEDYFGYPWDCGYHRLIRYKFGLDANPKVVPAYGDVPPGGDSDW
ncbi:hypothetical protein K525DRAFT_183160 [Schizophyllum commune Loenen D]|nr:hypothetical protein K525DRAFT_183160 [Schizophyllum commune Loenen D]